MSEKDIIHRVLSDRISTAASIVNYLCRRMVQNSQKLGSLFVCL